MSKVTLTVGSTLYAGWESVSVTRSIESIAGTFSLTCSEAPKGSDARKQVVPGARVSVQLDGKTIITGYIDDVDVTHSISEHTLSVSGRDAAGDLVDCSALYKSGEWSNQPMLSIAHDLCDPFGIEVLANVDVSKPFTTWTIEPGESVYENIDRMARALGVLVVSDGHGGILITRAGRTKVLTALVQGRNVLSASASQSHLQRFNQYQILSQFISSDENDPVNSTVAIGFAEDAAIKRHRPFIKLYEDSNADLDTLNKRAQWQANVNAARGQRATFTVQGWSHEKGLWQPNTLVMVDYEAVRIHQTELLIVAVRQTLDSNGSKTELTLSPADAYDIQPEPIEAFQ
jgi:prophage tail gpP-like protein